MTIQARHDKGGADLKQEVRQVVKASMCIDDLGPDVKGLLKWENYCKNLGLDKEGTKTLFTMQPYRYTGELHSIRYNHTLRASDVVPGFPTKATASAETSIYGFIPNILMK